MTGNVASAAVPEITRFGFSMLAKTIVATHIDLMGIALSPQAARGNEAKRIGRSPVTGHFVLYPATKGSRITIAKARSAANAIHSTKK